MIRREIIHTVLFFSIAIIGCYSQQGSKFYKTVQLPTESNQTEIYSVIQDSHGFIWFGTSQGLYKYDGLDFKIFNSKTGDNDSLLDDALYSLLEDNNGNIWIGSRHAGLSRLNTTSGEFTDFKLIDSTNTIKPNFISSIFQDREGTIWVGTQGTGLGKYLPKSNSFKYYLFDKTNESSIAQDYVNKIIEDDQGYLWLGLNGQGVDRFDPNSEAFKHYKFSQAKDQTLNFRKNVVRDLYDDGQGNILIAAYGGFNRLNKKTGEYDYYDISNTTILKSNSLNSITAIDDKLFITSYDGYVYEFSLKQEEFIGVENTKFNIRTSSLDSDKSIWLGMTDGKALMISPEHKFPFFKISDSIQVTSILKTNTSNYFGTNFNGVFSSRDVISTEKMPLQMSDFSVLTISDGPNDTVWFGTNSGGVGVYDPRNKKLEVFRNIPGNNSSLAHDTTLKIYKDQFNKLWVGTLFGLSQWLPDKKEFFNRGRTAFNDMLRLSKEELWCATSLGIAVINPITNAFSMKQVNYDQQENGLLHNQVNALFTSDMDSIFIGSKKGLNIFIKSENKMLNVHTLVDVPNVEIKAITQDHLKNYWMLTTKGLLHLDLKNKKYKFYDKSNGLDFNTSWNTALQFDKRTNKLMVGGNGGYYEFIPEPFEYDAEPIKISLSDFKVFNKPLAPEYSSQLKENGELKLPYDQNMITVSFAAMNFINPSSTNYKYQLEGLHKDWILTKERNATFTNLNPGKYTFKLNATNTDGIWNNNPTIVSFEILPPLWATWWAYSIYAILTVALLYLIVRAFIKRERLKANLKLEQVEVKKMQEVNDLKAYFFANISHEFRTPLTLIQGPVNDLLEETNDEKTINSLKIVQRNSSRLKRLIDQLLELSKLEAKKLTINEKVSDIWSFLRAICSSFNSMAENKNINYNVNIPDGSLFVLYDEQKIEMIIYNLVSNALKFTPTGGTITVDVGIAQKKEINLLSLIVKDTGIGFHESEKERIFERFYRLEQQSEVDGTGIGLALTKELVELMQGTILVEGEKGKGATFRVSLPLKVTKHREKIAKKSPLITTSSAVLEKENNDTDLKKSKILLVEDNKDLRNYIKDILKESYTVLEAVDGLQGLTTAQKEIPDLIISDFMMPNMEGNELCKHIKSDERTAHIPFVMLTAKASKEDKILGLELGADDYLFKPFDKKELQVKVTNILKQRERLQKKLQQEFIISPEKEIIESHEDRFLFKLKELVINNLGEAELNVNFLSKEMGLSRVQLYRKVNALLGLSASDFIRKLRIKKAAELLKNNWGSVSEVAYEVGFNNLSYFSKCFKEMYEQTPSSFIKKH